MPPDYKGITKMNRFVSRFLQLMLGISLLFVFASAPASAAAKVPVNLRVVTYKGAILYDGIAKAGTSKIKPNSSCLGGSAGKARTVTGPTALGAIADATARSAALRPFKISDGDFGFGICGFGKNVVKDENWWVFKYQHKSSMTGTEVTRVREGSDVLLYLAKSYNETTPEELVLEAPSMVRRNATVKVRVFAYNDQGKRKPVEGAKVSGTKALTNARGYSTVTVTRKTRLIARSNGTIPSNRAVIGIRK